MNKTSTSGTSRTLVKKRTFIGHYLRAIDTLYGAGLRAMSMMSLVLGCIIASLAFVPPFWPWLFYGGALPLLILSIPNVVILAYKFIVGVKEAFQTIGATADNLADKESNTHD